MEKTGQVFAGMLRLWTEEDASYAAKALEGLRPHYVTYSAEPCGDGYSVVAFHFYASWQDTTIHNDLEAIRYICQKEIDRGQR